MEYSEQAVPTQTIAGVSDRGLRSSLLISQGLAFFFWRVALFVKASNVTPVWFDQENTFTKALYHLADPQQIYQFRNPPWTAILLAPFSVLPLSIAVLIQLCLYFAILTLVIYKFGGDLKTVLLVLTSFIALDSALELNIEWLVCLGLLVPAAYSGPLLLIKPQTAFGVWLSFKRSRLVRAILVNLVVLVISLLVWGVWPLPFADFMQRNPPGWEFNIAPLVLIPWFISVGIGLVLGWRAFRRRDPVLGILCWLFFVPYLKFYALLPYFAVFAIRYWRVSLLLRFVVWFIFVWAFLFGCPLIFLS